MALSDLMDMSSGLAAILKQGVSEPEQQSGI